MIKEFKETPVRDTGVINRGMFEEIKKLYNINKEQAGELAISIVELVLTGDYSSDDMIIDLLLTNHKIITEKNQEKYDAKVESQQQNQIIKLKLKEIAEMLKQGYSQIAIARKIEETPQTVNYRVKILNQKYPWLLEDDNQKNQKNQKHDNDYDNENDNENGCEETFVSSLSSASPQRDKEFHF